MQKGGTVRYGWAWGTLCGKGGVRRGQTAFPPAPCTPDVHGPGVAGTDVKQKDWPNNKKREKRSQERAVTTKISDQKNGARRDRRAAVGERRQEIIHQMPGKGDEKREPGWRWEHDMDVEKKHRRAKVERMRNKDKRNTPEVETYCRGERSQDTPSGYGFKRH